MVRSPYKEVYMNIWMCWASAVHVAISRVSGGSWKYSVFTSLCFSETYLVSSLKIHNVGGEIRIYAIKGEKQHRACSWHLVNISFLPLSVCKASCTSKVSAAQNAKIDLHVGMWPLFPKCGPDVRPPCEYSRNVTASFFRTSLLLSIWRRLPFHALPESEKQEQERG